MSVQPQLLSSRRRVITVALSLALLAGLGTSAQAGVIPWVYDAIFGPVRPMAPYAPAYSVPVYSYRANSSPRIGATSYPTYSYAGYNGGFGCRPCYSPCQVQSPCVSGACANGACNVTGAASQKAPTTVAFYHPVYGWVTQRGACATSSGGTDKVVPTPDKGLANGTVGSQAPEAKKTFSTPKPGEKDPFVSPMSVKKPVSPRNTTDTAKTDATTNTDAKAAVVNNADKAAADKGAASKDDTTTKGDDTKADKAVVSTPAVPNAAATDATTTTTTTTSSSDAAAASKDHDATTTDSTTTDAKKADGGFAGQPERGIDDKAFVEPKPGEKAKEETGDKTLPLKEEDLTKGLELDNKTSWVVPTIGVERIAFRPGFRNARLVRNSKVINVDFVIPATSVTRIVSK